MSVNIELLVAILAPIAAFLIWLKMWTQTPTYLKQQVKDKDKEIDGWKHKFNVLNGKYSRTLGGALLPPGTKPIQAPEEGVEMVPALIESFAPYIPKKWRGLAKNPKIQGMIQGIYEKAIKDHPGAATEFINGFIPELAISAAKELGSDKDINQESYL